MERIGAILENGTGITNFIITGYTRVNTVLRVEYFNVTRVYTFKWFSDDNIETNMVTINRDDSFADRCNRFSDIHELNILQEGETPS